jgi:hypothetical protein
LPNSTPEPLELAERGLMVFPVDHPGLPECAGGQHHTPQERRDHALEERGKHACSNQWQDVATRSPVKIMEMFPDGELRNVGVCTNKSGLVVIDEDSPGAFTDWARAQRLSLPPTMTVQTGKGFHYYYTVTDGRKYRNSDSALPDKVNVRGNGTNAYVVGPGSVHYTGTLYTIQNDLAPAPLPEWLPDYLAVDVPTQPAGLPARGASLIALEHWLETAQKGSRNNALFWACCRAKESGVTTLEGLERFMVIAVNGLGLSAAEARQTAASALRQPIREQTPGKLVVPDSGLEIVTAGGGSTKLSLEVPNWVTAYAEPKKVLDDVANSMYMLEVRRLAQQAHAAKMVEDEDEPLAFADADEILLAAETESPTRIKGLLHSDAGMLLVAQMKTGKTTFLMNLAYSLLTGEPFLGKFPVTPVDGDILWLNYELSPRMAAEWTKMRGIDPKRLRTLNLRGKPNPFLNPKKRKELATMARAVGVETVLIDPFANAFEGSPDKVEEVKPWLKMLDTFVREEIGARDLVLAAHAGHSGPYGAGERVRGSSALPDWADTIVTLIKGSGGVNAPRYMNAIVRGGEALDEDEMAYDPRNLQLRLTGNGGRTAGPSATAPSVQISDDGESITVESKRAEVAEIMVKNGKPMTVYEIAQEMTGEKWVSDSDRKNVERTLRSLPVTGSVRSGTRMKEWSLVSVPEGIN